MTQGAVASRHAAGPADRYVVVIDGSAQSIDALRWAVRTATGTSARIEIITTWEPRVGMAGPYTPNVTLRPREGHAAGVLVEESKTVQLLVIGSRGLSGVAGLLLGSVSAHCAEKAHCRC